MSERRTLFAAKALVAALACMTIVPLGASLTSGATIASGARFEPTLLDRIRTDPTATVDALLTFGTDIGPLQIQNIAAKGPQVVRAYDEFGVAYVVGTGKQIVSLATLPGLLRVGANHPLQLHSDTASITTRAREAWDAKSTSTSPVTVSGATIDGTGVTIAIVDSGIDGGHPDLDTAMLRNQKFVCTTPGLISTATDTCFGNAALGPTLVGAPITGCTDVLWQRFDNTDTSSGHGTHVAGIAAGRGVASDGRIMGAAPGADLVGLSAGEGLSILFALESFNWVLCNSAAFDIGVVSNSWGLVAPFDPLDPVNVAVDDMIDDGVVVVFSAGNDGGTGTTDEVNTYARNPTPGVIGVANYDDLDIATRTNGLDASSSRCLAVGGTVVNEDNCADISAPGTAILSARASTGVAVDALGHPLSGNGRFLCCSVSNLAYSPYYVGVTGTSMAAPHVAGIVAMLQQADPTLTPADIEDILEDTANQFTTTGGYPAGSDASNPTNGINFAAGHGLVDAIEALEDSRVIGSSPLGSPLPQLSQDPHVYIEGVVDPQLVAGAPPTLSLQWTEVQGRPVDIAERFIVSGNTVAWGLAIGDDADFIVDGPGGVVDLDTAISADGTDFAMFAAHVFPSPGNYVIEAQIDFGSGLVAFDSFVVRIVA